MRQLLYILLTGLCISAMLLGCAAKTGDPNTEKPLEGDEAGAGIREDIAINDNIREDDAINDSILHTTITSRSIPVADITDFYYTYENINYNAFYQRYRFYVEDGKYMFFHETRERPNDYGWTTEEDRTAYGSLELTGQEWLDAMTLLKDGKVSKRSDSAESGDSGPWTYIYWKNDKSVIQQYDFAGYGARTAFEEHCAELAKRSE